MYLKSPKMDSGGVKPVRKHTQITDLVQIKNIGTII